VTRLRERGIVVFVSGASAAVTASLARADVLPLLAAGPMAGIDEAIAHAQVAGPSVQLLEAKSTHTAASVDVADDTE